LKTTFLPADNGTSLDENISLDYGHAFVSPMRTPRSGHGIITLNNGRVLVAGGANGMFDFDSTNASVEIYDPELNIWIQAQPMNTARSMHSIGKLIDGRIIVFGGFNLQGNILGTTEIYDPETNTWLPGPLMHTPRGAFSMVNLKDGRFFLATGTIDLEAGFTNTTEFFIVRPPELTYPKGLI
jgi:hypothetical protein